ncbi:MAG: hypothetical protein HYZ63_01365 [Candidatus Andersenbacteria bacterium]|nr:hypothetical protein [Candidatus Andersenbacteria bacterium]
MGAHPRRLGSPSWSAELAYVCGLLATDGCLISDGRHINITSQDIDQLETVKKILSLKNKISWKKSGYTGNLSSQVIFGDVLLHKWLISIGITPRKTFTIGQVKVPDQYFWDYLRGEFDGDGHSHAYWDTRWRSSVSLYIGFTCASKKHLEWINGTISRLIEIEGCIKPNHKAHSLLFSKQKAWHLYNKMYYGGSIYLARKKQKLDRQWEAVNLAKQHKQPIGFIKGGPVLRIT